jgi:hypothetical protein
LILLAAGVFLWETPSQPLFSAVFLFIEGESDVRIMGQAGAFKNDIGAEVRHIFALLLGD